MNELQETLEQLRADYYTETILSGNLEAERNEALQCIAQLKAQLNGMEHSNRNWRRRALAAEERQAQLDRELNEVRALRALDRIETTHPTTVKIIPRRSCKTCRFYLLPSGEPWCTLDSVSCAPPKWQHWEAKVETTTGVGTVVSIRKRPDLVIADEWEARDG